MKHREKNANYKNNEMNKNNNKTKYVQSISDL